MPAQTPPTWSAPPEASDGSPIHPVILQRCVFRQTPAAVHGPAPAAVAARTANVGCRFPAAIAAGPDASPTRYVCVAEKQSLVLRLHLHLHNGLQLRLHNSAPASTPPAGLPTVLARTHRPRPGDESLAKAGLAARGLSHKAHAARGHVRYPDFPGLAGTVRPRRPHLLPRATTTHRHSPLLARGNVATRHHRGNGNACAAHHADGTMLTTFRPGRAATWAAPTPATGADSSDGGWAG